MKVRSTSVQFAQICSGVAVRSTSLKFDEDGQGSMLLPESEYAFRYVLEDDKLTLHFASSRAKDVSYIVSVCDNSMKLTGGRETIVQELILKRIEQKQEACLGPGR